MSVHDVATSILVGAVALAFVSVAGAQQKPGPMVEWVMPAVSTNKPQTPEQAEEGRQKGRELPPPEILQPMLDPALPAYQPRKDVKVTGTFKGAASDVMVVLAQKWIEKFKTY